MNLIDNSFYYCKLIRCFKAQLEAAFLFLKFSSELKKSISDKIFSISQNKKKSERVEIFNLLWKFGFGKKTLIVFSSMNRSQYLAL